MPPEIVPVDPNLPMPQVGGCFIRNSDGSLSPDPSVSAPAPAEAPAPEPEPE